jgi:hypothetical protein
MPRVSFFFGIVIRMFHNDHLPPHFHAEYGDDEAVYQIDTLDVLRGKLSHRAHALVVKWASLHRTELRVNWNLARRGALLNVIDPLD